MIWDNYIGFDYLIPPEVCQSIIKLGEEKIKNNFGDRIITENRNDISIFLEDHESYRKSSDYLIVNNTIKMALNEFCDNFLKNRNLDHYILNCHKFQKAESAGGFYKWHIETSGPEVNNRAFVWMLYLNTVEKGGCTEFLRNKDEKIRIKPEIGKFVFWPAGETHLHRSSPDLQETKYILTGWINRP
jgi:hypothetical protein